ncbi:kinase-like domain-containing protein [Suillus occidentalis]|nr:kinase-like domain-containing protein [Suillus occidentalis]
MPPKPTQPLPSENDMRSEPRVVQIGRGRRTMTALINTLTLSRSGSQRGSSLGRTVTTAARSDTVLDVHSTSSQQDAGGDIIDPERISQSSDDDSQASISEPPSPSDPLVALAKDLTGQIFGTINDYVASGAFGNVYRCEWRQPSGTVKVAVKSFRNPMNRASEQDRRRFRRETAIWAHLVHDNIVTLYGTTEGFGPSTALVSQWFPDGTLFRLITERGTTLTIESKLKLLHDIASGLYYLHSSDVVHGDITSSNVLVDVKDGEYKACLTDFGLSNVLCGHLNDRPIEGSTVRPGSARWTAPELLGPHETPSDIKPTTQNDMYSFGRVMFHLLTLVVPWYGIDEYKVVQKIQQGEVIPRPEISEATSDVTDARWNHIEHCWSINPSDRPSAFEAMGFLKREQEALKQDDVIVGGAQGSHQNAYLVVEQV